MRAAQGAASSAQATDRSLPGRPESSFPPLGLLSPPNPLRWASAGAPITVSANGAGGDADPVFASSVQPTAAMSPRFWGAPGAHPRPFLSHRFLSERKRCARRVGGAGGASDKNPAKPPSKKRPAPRGHPGRRMARRGRRAPRVGGYAGKRATTGRPYRRSKPCPGKSRADTIRPYRLGSWQTVGGPSLPIIRRPTSGRCRTGWSPARHSENRPACPRRTRRAPPGSPGRRTRP